MTLATQEDIVDAQVVLTKVEALQLVEELRQLATTYAKTKAAIREKLEYARNSNAWEQIDGCKSYGDFIAHTFGDIPIRWDRDDRQELVADMAFHENGGMSTRQIGNALGVGKSTIDRDLAGVPDGTPEPRRVQGSDGKTYKTKPKDEWPVVPPAEPDEEKEMPAALAHDTPYKPGHVLTLDSRGTKPLITVGEDGRATSTRESYIKALNWWRDNPRAQQYTAVKETGLPTSAMSETSSALRKNGEIPKVSNSGRAPIEEFGLLATAVKNLGLSVEKMLSEGTFEFIDSEGMDYYMDGLRDGMKSLRKFQQLAQQISNN